jgi:pentatricopeptide repeat protein
MKRCELWTCTSSLRPWECAVSLLSRMQEHGLSADTQTFSSAISACEVAGQWQRALGILQSMMDVDKEGDADDDDNDDDSSVLNQYCFNVSRY